MMDINFRNVNIDLSFFTKMNVGMWVLDGEGKLEDVDESFCSYSGCSKSYLIENGYNHLLDNESCIKFSHALSNYTQEVHIVINFISCSNKLESLLTKIYKVPKNQFYLINFFKVDIDGKSISTILEKEDLSNQRSFQKLIEENNINVSHIHQFFLYEQKLLNLKKFYEQILTNASAEIVVYNSNLNYDFINISEVTNAEIRKTLIGKNDYYFCKLFGINPKVADQRFLYLKEALDIGKSIEFEEEIQYSFSFQPRYYMRTITLLKNEVGHIKNLVCYGMDITRRKKAEAEVYFIANHDSLTNLPNRRHLYSRMEAFLDNPENEDANCAILLCDLDRFKTINDSLGHLVGDLLIQLVSERLLHTSVKFPNCEVYRLGGDEFIVTLLNTFDPSLPEKLAQDIIKTFQDTFLLKEHELYISTSVGLYLFKPSDISSIETIVQNADIAMYYAKESGRNNYKVFDSKMSNKNEAIFKVETNILKGYRNNEFVYYYQPIIDVLTQSICGMEALIRWKKDGGVLVPSSFLDIAENSGITVPLGNQSFKGLFIRWAEWNQKYKVDLKLAINLTRKQFYQESLLDVLDQNFKETGFNPSNLIIEIKEDVIMKVPEQSLILLSKLHSKKINISIDDFGSASSSLSQLKNYPIDIINIGRSFIKEVTENYQDAAVAGAIISMAKNLGLKVHAEGVEQREQFQYLAYLECNTVQGYLFSPPLSEPDAEKILKKL